MKRMLARMILTFTCIAMVPWQSAFAQELSLKKLTVRYGPIPDVQIMAQQLGWFEEELGVEIDWRSLNGGAATIAAMQSGALDIGCAVGTPPIAAAAAQGIPLKVFWIQDNAAEELAVNPSIKNFQDLKGKKIAALIGSTMYFALAVALEKEGLSPKDLKIIDLPIEETVSAYKRGDIDGALLPHPMVDALYEDGAITLMSAKDRTNKYGYSLFDACIVMDSWAAEHKDVLEKWIKVEEKAVQYYRANPQEAAAAVAKAIQLSPEVALTGLKAAFHPSAKEQLEVEWLGQPGSKGSGVAEAIKITADFQKSMGRVARMPEDVDSLIDSSHIVNALGN